MKNRKKFLTIFIIVLLVIGVKYNSNVAKQFIEENKYDEIIVATGAHERKLDTYGFEQDNVTYAIDTLLNTDITGDNILIVGGGLTGIEIACDLGKKGKNVTVVEAEDTILNAFGLSAANYNMLMEMIDYYRIKVMKSSKVDKYENNIAYVTTMIKNYPNIANRAKLMFAIGTCGIPEKSEIKAKHIIVSVGYVSNNKLYNEIKSDNVYLIGDAIKPENVMKAIWDAYDIAREIQLGFFKKILYTIRKAV